MSTTQLTEQEISAIELKMFETIKERINLMLQDFQINFAYQGHKTEKEAQDWIFNLALCSLYGVQNMEVSE